jgi:enamine deaminase RidA (YjgF/YER057c/UK114 family)
MRAILGVAAALAMLSGCVAVDVTETGASARREAIIPASMQSFHDEYHFSPAVRAGDFVFLSGVASGVPAGQEQDPAALEASFDRAFRGVATVLTEAGADWGDVVEMTTYHTDLPAQFDIFSRVKDRYVGQPYPAWTAIDVDRLLPNQGVVEVRVIAYAPQP